MHSDVICHSCFLIVTEYTTIESRLCSIRSGLSKTFDKTAAEHALDQGNKSKMHYNIESEDSCKQISGIINEKGNSVITGEIEFSDYVSDKVNFNETKHKVLQKKRKSVKKCVSRPFSCSVCRKDFRAYSHHLEHMLIHLGEKPWLCKECNKSFRTKSALKVHSVKHTGYRPYNCEQCNKSFAEKCSLEEHNRIHSGEKPFRCDFCERSFTRKKDLVIHLKTHTGDKPYKCSQCPKSFAVKSRLERHFMIHSGEKPYSCEHCPKSFARKDDFKLHVRLHTGEKPFQCSHCDKTFTNHSNRLAHIRTHTGIKKYSCNMCKNSFKLKKKFQEHLNAKHRSEVIKENVLAQAQPYVQETVIHFSASSQVPLSEPEILVVSPADLHTLQPVPTDPASQVSWKECPDPSVDTTYLNTDPPSYGY
ncbi:hypothetical protein R5R35_009971 [Gryllus longicercus]